VRRRIKDGEKSSQAEAAKLIKKEMTRRGYKCRARSSSFSMGDSVTIEIETPDLPPEKRKELAAYCDQYQYGSFNGMEDIYEYDNTNADLPQSKYVHCNFVQSDECRAAIWEYLQDIGNMTDHERENLRHQVWSGVWGNFWETWKPAAQVVETATVTATSYAIEKHHHTKKDFDFYIVLMADRVERPEFIRLRNSCKAAGGWYSRNFGKTPGGFAFKEREAAGAWAIQEFSGPDGVPPDTQPPSKPKQDTHTAGKLRTLAEKLTPQIEAKHGDRQTNTPKRQRQAMSARIDGDRLQRTQQALSALADLHDAGEVPAVLRGVKTKKAVFELVGTVLNSTGYYHVGCTGEPSKDTPEARAIWELLKPKSPQQAAEEALRDKVEALQFSKIPGYFATPPDLVADMLDHAQIKKGHSVLEPSAGSGAIVDQLADLHADPLIVVHECNHTLCEILQAKGYDARPGDFLESNGSFQFDRVVMNPPFEKLQDIDHVCHAFSKLKEGGRLVAIMSPGPFFRDDQKCRTFRGWFETLGGEVIDIEAGAFKDSGTGVSSKLVVIDKPEEAAKVTPQVEALPGMAPLGVKEPDGLKAEMTEQASLF